MSVSYPTPRHTAAPTAYGTDDTAHTSTSAAPSSHHAATTDLPPRQAIGNETVQYAQPPGPPPAGNSHQSGSGHTNQLPTTSPPAYHAEPPPRHPAAVRAATSQHDPVSPTARTVIHPEVTSETAGASTTSTGTQRRNHAYSDSPQAQRAGQMGEKGFGKLKSIWNTTNGTIENLRKSSLAVADAAGDAIANRNAGTVESRKASGRHSAGATIANGRS